MKKYPFIALLLGFVVVQSSMAQVVTQQKHELVNQLAKVLQNNYVFPDVADSMAALITAKMQAGQYDTISRGENLAFQLTRDLQNISRDLHLKVEYSETAMPVNETETESQDHAPWMNQLLIENNFGIKSKKILEGNIGYLEIPMFGPLGRCADTLIAAMKTVQQTDALLLDLRDCRGSLDENTIPFLCSYFFSEPVHLFDFYTRESNTTKQFWTYAWVPGERYAEKPVFVITSGRTFSGGEELAYDLQQLKRAVVVGEVTRGGANPTELVILSPHYRMAVPSRRSVNPVSQTNWEQVGVKPDVASKSNIALYTAHLEALQKLTQNSADEKQKAQLAAAIARVKAAKPQFRLVNFHLKGFQQAKEVAVSGSFNSWNPKGLPLKKNGSVWTAEAEALPGKLSYKFIVDGQWITDPENPATVTENGYENSLLIVK